MGLICWFTVYFSLLSPYAVFFFFSSVLKETLSQQCSALPLIIREDRASEFSHQAINLWLGLGDEGAFSGDPRGIICSPRPAAETHCRARATETHSPVATWGSGCGHWCGEKLNWCNTQLLRFEPPVCVIVGYYHTHTHTHTQYMQ